MEHAMRTFLLATAILAVVAAPTAAAAQASLDPTSRNATEAPLAAATAASSERISDALLTSIMTWLSINFDLKPTTTLPNVRFASAAAIAQHRSRAFLGTGDPSVVPTDTGRATVAIYDRTETTIHLQQDWTGRTPAELSVLVHEMVHHQQNVAQTKFECPQAREQIAYAAQQRWLELFGRTLETEFQIDPFTLLVTTRCMY
jgi:hypothetical protein